MPKMRMVVTADVPNGVSREDFAAYVSDAVAIWKGSLNPDCDLFDLGGDSVTIKDELENIIYTRAET